MKVATCSLLYLTLCIRESPKWVLLQKVKKPLNGYIINSEDPDEMPHYAAFHQGLHCKDKEDVQTKEYNIFFKSIN